MIKTYSLLKDFTVFAVICVLEVEKGMKLSVAQSCLTLCDPTDCRAHQAPLSMESSREEYWSGYLCS